MIVARNDSQRTSQLIAARLPVIYQAAFETDRFVIACDLLVLNSATNSYDLYEVKASTSGDDKKANDDLYTYDLAFQSVVLRDFGVPLGRQCLVRLNSDYVRGERLDLDGLFTQEDFTERVKVVVETLDTENGDSLRRLAT